MGRKHHDQQQAVTKHKSHKKHKKAINVPDTPGQIFFKGLQYIVDSLRLNTPSSEVRHEDLDLANEGELEEFRNSCGELYKLLQKGTIQPKLKPTLKNKRSDGTCDDVYFLRDPGTRGVVLVAEEAFQMDTAITSKVFGFVRIQGHGVPLKYSFAGVSPINSRKHKKLLENPVWQGLVSKWADANGQLFKKGPYEEKHGVKPGTYSAAHVEPKLIIWFCCKILREILPQYKYSSFDEQIKVLWRIRTSMEDREHRITAEIILNRQPCQGCCSFRDIVEEYTGLRFKLLECATVGISPLGQNKHRQKSYPLLTQSLEALHDESASETETEIESEEDYDLDSEEETAAESDMDILSYPTRQPMSKPSTLSKSQLQVVIHSNSKQLGSPLRSIVKLKALAQSQSSTSRVKTSTVVSSVHQIRGFTFLPHAPHRKQNGQMPIPTQSLHARVEDEDDDDDEYELPYRHRTKKSSPSDAQDKKSTRGTALFEPEALMRGKHMRELKKQKKRARKGEESTLPAPAKKRRTL